MSINPCACNVNSLKLSYYPHTTACTYPARSPRRDDDDDDTLAFFPSCDDAWSSSSSRATYTFPYTWWQSSITLPEFLFYSNTIATLTAQKLQQENKRQNKKQNETKAPGPMVMKSAVVLFQIDFSPPNCGSPENRAQTTGASDNRVRLRCLLRCESLFHLYSIDCTLVLLTLGRQNLGQSKYVYTNWLPCADRCSVDWWWWA